MEVKKENYIKKLERIVVGTKEVRYSMKGGGCFRMTVHGTLLLSPRKRIPPTISSSSSPPLLFSLPFPFPFSHHLLLLHREVASPVWIRACRQVRRQIGSQSRKTNVDSTRKNSFLFGESGVGEGGKGKGGRGNNSISRRTLIFWKLRL